MAHVEELLEGLWTRGQLRTGGRPTSASPRLSFVVVLLALAAPLPLDGQIPPEFRQAAEQGDAEGQFLLGLAHTGGEGVPEDDAEAVRWFLMAAEQGHAEAVPSALAYYGTGWPRHWWLQANHAEAQLQPRRLGTVGRLGG